ncbi:MAG: mycofactocin biosynthesis peptidyl-dipeptidase MftE, partial [Actinobacteria bacterium]|nr:mycofactocin biosynthesis peptidyl-dipeptidase MftE [Actinomycetota bacterium]
LPAYDGSDLHAGRTETSVMLHVSPGSVDMSRAVPGTGGTASELLAPMRTGGVRAVSATGVLGDPTAATAVHGKSVFAMWVSSLARRIDALTAQRGTQ